MSALVSTFCPASHYSDRLRQYQCDAHWVSIYRTFGLTENAGRENDGPKMTIGREIEEEC